MNATSIRWPHRAVSFLALLGILALYSAQSRGDELPSFTGYTRPGFPSGKVTSKEGKILFVSTEGEAKKAVLGGTVYFTVIDTLGSEEDDLWIKIGKGFVQSFVPGRDQNSQTSPEFDNSARYLYLYQTVNDLPEAQDAIRSSAVMLIDPELITSWGYFTGHGFTFLTAPKKGDRVIRPVSYGDPIEPENRVYWEHDGPHQTETLFQISAFSNRGKDDVRPIAAGDDPVRNPDSVVLARGRDQNCSPYSGWLGGDSFPRANLGGGETTISGRPGYAESDFENRTFVRANWIGKNLLKPHERGAIFGFTSNFPPIYDDVRLRGIRVAPADSGGIRPAADDGGGSARATGASPAGQVPTPIPPAPAGAGAGAGFLGGFVPSGGFGGGGGFPGISGFFPPRGIIGSGLTGSTGSSGNQSQAGQQAQNQNQQEPQTQIVNVIVQQNQQQNQQQQQQQQQQQEQENNGGNMVPEPSTYLLALFGLPLMVFLIRRKGLRPALNY